MTFLEWFNYYGDGLGAMAAIAAAVVAILALASAASDNRARSQPMVTAELRPAVDNDQAADLVLINLGQTPARDLVVRFEPELNLPVDVERGVAQFIVQRYSNPLAVLNPGQQLANVWWSGKDVGGEMLVNREPLPNDITVHVSYRGRGRRRLKGSFPLTMDSVMLTTVSVSSSSMKGRVKSIDGSLKKLAEKTSMIASVLNRAASHVEPSDPSDILRMTGFGVTADTQLPTASAAPGPEKTSRLHYIRRQLSRLRQL